jgi:hypothetical protein
MMGKRGTNRLRDFINKTLHEKGPMTTGGLLDAYNQHSRHGSSMNIIGNVLHSEAVQVGFIEKEGHVRIRMAVWGLKEEA